MTRHLSQLLIIISIILIALPLKATGPSHATIKIIPIASNSKGSVLFKTYALINKSGRHSLEGAEYGWLCVSSNGIWEERLHYRFTEADAEDSAKVKLYADNFKNRTDLKNPPESLKEFIDKYDFINWQHLDPITGKGKAVWSADNVCIRQRCSNHSIKQNTLGGISSNNRKGIKVTSGFCYEGIMLFENSFHFQEDEPRGAYFPIANIFQEKDIGIDIYNITGVSIFKPQ